MGGLGGVRSCTARVSGPRSSRVPDAKGVQAVASQESIDRIGDAIDPNARYSVSFADGPLVYEVAVFGPPDAVSRQQVEDIAGALYERVSGAPLPGSP